MWHRHRNCFLNKYSKFHTTAARMSHLNSSALHNCYNNNFGLVNLLLNDTTHNRRPLPHTWDMVYPSANAEFIFNTFTSEQSAWNVCRMCAVGILPGLVIPITVSKVYEYYSYYVRYEVPMAMTVMILFCWDTMPFILVQIYQESGGKWRSWKQQHPLWRQSLPTRCDMPYIQQMKTLSFTTWSIFSLKFSNCIDHASHLLQTDISYNTKV